MHIDMRMGEYLGDGYYSLNETDNSAFLSLVNSVEKVVNNNG